ncbi:hypothetical protein ACWD3J_40985 [Streptomyces sp. NPDC002755]|uniref:hypothetical protein n=1 Tax=Streptomyces sp. NPDC002884 TaxID=3154544 RepID=UPI00333190E2
MGSPLLTAVTVALFAVAGSVTAFLAGAPAVTALPAGAGIGGLVWAAYSITGRLTRPATGRPGTRDADRPTDAPPEPPADAHGWLTRAAAAADRLEQQCRQSPSASLWPALATAATSVRVAADRLTAAAEAVRVIDTSGASADHRVLHHEQKRLEGEARALQDGPLRRAKQDAARATGERVATLERLAELRRLLITTMEATALRLEAAAERGAMLLSLQAATDVSAVPTDLTALDHELEAVQAGLDTLDEITRSLHGTAEEQRE